MGSYTSITGGIAADASVAYTLGQGLQRAIQGDKRKCSFIQNNSVVIEFDAVASEAHSQQSGPTVYPLEDGQSISDHIIVAPFELSITGIVVDAPINNRDALTQEVITSAANFVAGPLGVLDTAFCAQAGIMAQRGTTSPSAAAYNTLYRLVAGDVANRVTPSPFTVVTSLRKYDNMVMRSLSVPRDANTGACLVFSMSLIQLTLVSPQQVNIKIFANPAVSSHKQNLGEKSPLESLQSDVANAVKSGSNDGDRAVSASLRFPEAG